VKMELLDSRCEVCKPLWCQCSTCQVKDKLRKKQARQAAAAAKLAGANSPALLPKVPEKGAGVTSVAVDPKDAPKQSLKNIPKTALAAVNPKDAPKQSLRHVLKSPPHDWKMTKIPRSGHCLFESIALAFKKLNRPDLPQTWQDLRSVCSKQLLKWKGVIPGLPINPGMAKVQINRGEKEVDVTLEEYCNLIATSLYGGSDEIMIIVQMFKVQIHVFHDESYTGGDPIPVQIFMVNPEMPETHEVNLGNSMQSSAVVF
jgi:hypothetical protein